MDWSDLKRRHPSTSSCPVHYYLEDDDDYSHHRIWGATAKIDRAPSGLPIR